MAINATIPGVIQPLVNTVNYFVNVTQVLIGGMFGLYILSALMSWLEKRKTRKTIGELKQQLLELNATVKRLEKIIVHMPNKKTKQANKRKNER